MAWETLRLSTAKRNQATTVLLSAITFLEKIK